MIKKLLAVAVAMTVAACASPYVATPYDRTGSSVRSIAVLDDSAPEKSIAYEVASVGRNFGLIGALVDAGIQAERQAAVNRALETAQFDGEAIFERRLAAKLSSEGYQVSMRDTGPREKQAFIVAYPTADGTTDAYLDIVVAHHGYLSAGAFQPFRPSAAAQVRLVSASDPTKILMDNRIVYNGMTAADAGVITLTPNPEFEFKNREELLADPVKMAAGIEDALNQIADTTAQLLR